MFDVRDALANLNGRKFPLQAIRRELARIRFTEGKMLPAEYGSAEIFEIARRLKLIVEQADGEFKVKVR